MSQITAIMIDSREPAWVQSLKFGGIPCMVTMLETGDAQAVTDDGCTLIFERKTLSDFLGSIADERIFTQCARMTALKSATQYAYLVITEPITAEHGKIVEPSRGVTGWSFASVMGALLSIQEMGVHIVFANGQNDYEDCILRIGARNRSPETRIAAPRPARALGPKIDFLTGLPGIGIEKAQEILAWAGDNLSHALVGLTDTEIKSPVGIGIRKRIRDLLGLQESERLEIVGTEINEPIMQGEK